MCLSVVVVYGDAMWRLHHVEVQGMSRPGARWQARRSLRLVHGGRPWGFRF